MTPITDRLSALAAQMREDARQAGINATKARPAVEQAVADVAAARKLLAEAEKAHREAEAVVARHELIGQKAADVAADLDRLAARHRDAPELPTPDETIAAVGQTATIRECGKCGDQIMQEPGDIWRHSEHGSELCRPNEAPFSPSADPRPADEGDPFNVTQASATTVAAVEQATGELVAVHGPGVTAPMTDRLAAERFPGPRHEKPKERPGPLARITRRTGPHRVIASPDATRPDTDVPDALLAEGERQARPDAPEGEK